MYVSSDYIFAKVVNVIYSFWYEVFFPGVEDDSFMFSVVISLDFFIILLRDRFQTAVNCDASRTILPLLNTFQH